MDPERIFLQPDEFKYVVGFGDRTWATSNISGRDTEYVRADLFVAAQARVKELEADLEKLPKTADGVLLLDLGEYGPWFLDVWFDKMLVTMAEYIQYQDGEWYVAVDRDDGYMGHNTIRCPLESSYSTEAAAQAAKENFDG